MIRSAALSIVLSLAILPLAAEGIPTPSEHLRITVGADRTLADYRQIVSYFEMLASRSPRVELQHLGPTTLNESMIMAIISSERNIARKDRIKEIGARLADPRGLTAEQIDALAKEGRAVVLVTCNIHSTEIASSQMAMEWAHALATAEDEETLRRLDNVVLLLVPSLNPDGQIMVTDWYKKHLGTRWEGGAMPWLYHHYIGHDNNRDWFMLTQRETRAMTRAIYHEWFPQLFVDEHQMGSDGPRMFIPPFSDPMDPDVHPLIWREVNLIGSSMAYRLEQQRKAGVIYGYSFDAYWLGGTRNTGWWKNITGLLLEVASARIATPIWIDPTELQGGRKGLVEYKAQVNHPNPWKGGWWRLRDIIDYERIASDALLEVAADRREDLLRDIARRAADAIAGAAPGEGYAIPSAQHDAPTARRLAQLLADHNVEVIEEPGGDFWIPLAQPYGLFVREMLEPQRYPEVRLVRDSEALAPYDVATWTLPLLMGVEVRKTTRPGAITGRRLSESLLLETTPQRPLPDLDSAPHFSFPAGSAESSRVLNAALRGGGKGWMIDSGTSNGRFLIDQKGAKAAAAKIRGTGTPLTPASVPEGARSIRLPRVATYKPWNPSMDEGWTRWLLEQYGFATQTFDNRTIREAAKSARSLLERVDAIILADISKDIIQTGRPKRDPARMSYFVEMPPEYQGGIGSEGAEALRRFVEGGGTLIALDSASDWVIEQFNVPVRNVLAEARPADFNSPGSLLRAEIRSGHVVTTGLPSELAIFLDDTTAFQTAIPGSESRRQVLASYPEDARDILLSGWIDGAGKLTRRAAAVAVGYGKGKIVLFGFRPQHRAQTHATFPMLFNALYWSVMSEE
ncbi:MAG TPA: M14 metallopeptidase family protein [Thermoanaerobaculia bacterium]|nr:M14 metallopeptidase family protein [Thermoanaerobaculia bacterium]